MRGSLTVWEEGGNVRGLPILVCSLLMGSLVLLLKMACYRVERAGAA